MMSFGFRGFGVLVGEYIATEIDHGWLVGCMTSKVGNDPKRLIKMKYLHEVAESNLSLYSKV